MRTFALSVFFAVCFAIAGVVTASQLMPQLMPVAEAPEPVEPELDRGEVETIVREYLLENPEILEEVSIALQAQHAAEEEQRRQAAIADNRAVLFESDLDFSTGNPDGDIVIVEFFDYNCPYCKRAHADMVDLMQSDAGIKVIYKEFPVLGPGSIEATRVALAAGRQGRYLDMHGRLISTRGEVNEAIALGVAEDLGLDMEKLATDLQDPELMRVVEQTHRLADALGIGGTPSYVLGDEVIVGAVGFGEMQRRVAEVRDAGCVTC